RALDPGVGAGTNEREILATAQKTQRHGSTRSVARLGPRPRAPARTSVGDLRASPVPARSSTLFAKDDETERDLGGRKRVAHSLRSRWDGDGIAHAGGSRRTGRAERDSRAAAGWAAPRRAR